MAQGFFPWDEVPCLHISFHLDCHFNSVRREDDPCNGDPITKYPIGNQLKKIEQADQKKVTPDPKKVTNDANKEEPKKVKKAQASTTASSHLDDDEEMPSKDELTAYSS